jgi:hypothetical protein
MYDIYYNYYYDRMRLDQRRQKKNAITPRLNVLIHTLEMMGRNVEGTDNN